MSDLRERVPGHSLVDELLRQWDRGTIHIDPATNGVVIDAEAESWYRGVIGERRVAELLGRLGERWTVLHSVPVGEGQSDIDHVVIGEAGVFTINTKYSPGRKVWVAGYGMYVDSHQQHYVRNSVSEAARASHLLSLASGLTIPVIGLIVFVEPSHITRKAPAGGGDATPVIRVVSDSELLHEFSGRPIFSAEQVARIADAAVRPETWRRVPLESTNGHHIAEEFAALEEAVGPRLAPPVIRPTSQPRAYPSAPARSTSRPPRARSNRGRRPKQSPFERLLFGLMGPAIGLVMFWGVMQYLSTR